MFLAPFALLLSFLALPIILMYMLRLRRREVVISSTLLWQQLTRDREANAPWQKLRRNLLLLLQLLILAMLVLALARPFIPVASVVNNSVVVLLDASASMQATDVTPNRFEVAKQQIETLINDLSGNNQMTIIQVGASPDVLAAATNDKNILRQALIEAQPGHAPANWPAAFALAAGAAQGFQEAQVVLVSDGGLPAGLPTLPAETIYLPVGQSADNLAISALATRPNNNGVELFTSVRNEGVVERTALLSIHLDGQLYDARQVTIPPQSHTNLTWQLADTTALITAELSNNEFDNLTLDNRALTVHEAGVKNRVLLVTEGNRFLEQIYAVLPGLETFKAPPDTDLTKPEAGQFDLYVFDSVPLPNPPPAGDMLIINPQNSDLIQVTGVVTDTNQTAAIRLVDSPLLQFVDWSGVNILQMKTVTANWAQNLVEAEGGPLVMVGEQNGQRAAVITFRLQDSDLPLKITFPILIANLTQWLSPGRAFDLPEGELRPGAVVSLIPNANTTAVRVTKPDGTNWQAELGNEPIFYTETELLGLYQVALQTGGEWQPAGNFAINLFSPSESAIRPQEVITVGAQPIATATEDNLGQWEFWGWLAAIALAVLLVEWWIYHRGTQWPDVMAIPTEATGFINNLRQRWKQ